MFPVGKERTNNLQLSQSNALIIVVNFPVKSHPTGCTCRVAGDCCSFDHLFQPQIRQITNTFVIGENLHGLLILKLSLTKAK